MSIARTTDSFMQPITEYVTLELRDNEIAATTRALLQL